MKIPIIPDWCKGLPDGTMLYSCDILEFFEYKPKDNCITGYINDGFIPEPSESNVNMRGSKRATKYVWHLGDIRKLRAKMINEQLKEGE